MAQQVSSLLAFQERRRHADFFGSLRNANLRVRDVRSVRRYADLERGFLLKRGFTHDPKSHSPRSHGIGVASAAKSNIGHEHRAVCWSPRRERSVNALCSWGDCNHADREFGFADLVLIALAQTAKPSAIRSQRLCFRPPNLPCNPKNTRHGRV